MANYAELRALFGEGALVNATEVAVVVKAQTIFSEATPSAARLAWADSALTNTRAEGEKLLKYALAANKDLTVAQFRAAVTADPPTAFQATVDAAINKLYP